MRNIPFGRPIIGEAEKAAVAEVLENPILVHGPKSKAFEKAFADYTGAPYAVSLSSCTAGLHLCYFNLGVGAGDEVIVPSQTHAATVHAVEFCGAKPVFVDAEEETGNIDISQIEDKITDNTKALSLVHYLGMPVDMDRINSIASKHNLFVVEDCALAIGSYYKGVHTGLHGDAGCFSFYPVKHMTTAEGGMLITRHQEVADNIELKKAFGVDRHVGERKIPGEYDVTDLGFNYRLNEMQCAMGIEQVKRLDGFLASRKSNYEVLEAGLKEIEEINLFQSSHGDFTSSYYCLSILLKGDLSKRRTEIINKLKEKGAGTSIYYPRPVAHLSYYKNKYGYDKASFPVAAMISSSSIALPVGPHLDREDMCYIVEMLKNTLSEVK